MARDERHNKGNNRLGDKKLMFNLDIMSYRFDGLINIGILLPLSGTRNSVRLEKQNSARYI